MNKIVLIRHGQSEWNLLNKFTGWTDVDLTDQGLKEAREAGIILRENGFNFDMGYCSVLKRSIRTLWIILHEMDNMWIPIQKNWHLNERHYGALQGLNKKDTAEKYGDEQVHEWRRSMKVRPPALAKDDPRHDVNDPKYQHLHEEDIPLTENLEDTERRVLSYWKEEIVPNIKAGKHIIVSCHGNTIRSLVQHLDQISADGIADLNIPTGIPLVYELDDHLKPIRHYYLSINGEVPEGEIPKHIPEIVEQEDRHLKEKGMIGDTGF
ncbi:2,3-diphosphoglycerate-dependent phosphoglycerate mutase [Falsibacillus albus]|uniref:2,3-bisphosphoglycerate-dependent phosphoglycerate mutase n=1 Tax=Falsibacillus albus TaxID=2478915 RepID=A0A3L7K0C9_9BACI|nr:2,3-diphosphoglycerate-dependent phosphoglycerate mutase [Falsibacillus albus]RLQ96220.1 2,3-diphosphoglycerate-dependent phosphoglycerate mutase [Falsibacillus albus]